MWANVKRIEGKELYYMNPSLCIQGEVGYGWPIIAVTVWDEMLGTPFDARSTWHPFGVATNLLISLGILFAVAVGCEWWVRRRKRAKPV